MRRALFLIFASLLIVPQGAVAAGKPGLWTVTTTWQFGMPIVPPAIASLVRQQKLKPPINGQPFIHYMCMTGAEADGSEPLHFNNRDLDCVNRTVSQRGGRMVLESVCHGPLEGVGRAQISWRDGNFVLTDVSSYGTWVRFGASDSELALRRQECVLMSNGEIALGAPFEDFTVPTVSFKFADGKMHLQKK